MLPHIFKCWSWNWKPVILFLLLPSSDLAFIEFSLSVLLFGLDVMFYSERKKGQFCTLRNSFIHITHQSILIHYASHLLCLWIHFVWKCIIACWICLFKLTGIIYGDICIQIYLESVYIYFMVLWENCCLQAIRKRQTICRKN